jgi:hypothetical protein
MAGKKEHRWPWKKIKKGVPADPLGTGPTGSRPAAPAKGQGGTASLPESSGSASAFAKNPKTPVIIPENHDPLPSPVQSIPSIIPTPVQTAATAPPNSTGKEISIPVQPPSNTPEEPAKHQKTPASIWAQAY